MVTLAQLQAQKRRILTIRNVIAKKQKIEFEKIELQKEIRELQRSPGTSRNIKLLKRTGIGFSMLSKKIGAAGIRQLKRIKDQQLRDNAAFKKVGKKISKQGQVITGKGKKRKVTETRKIKKIKTGQRLSKIKEGQGFDVFSNLDF